MKRTAIAAALLVACGSAAAENTFQLDLGTTFANQMRSSDGTAALLSYGNGFRGGIGYVSDQTITSTRHERCLEFDRGYGYTGLHCYEVPKFDYVMDDYVFLFGSYTHTFREGRTFRPTMTMGLTLQEEQDHVLSSNYSFMTGIGFKVGRFSLTWTHLSNAGLEGANWGQDFITVGFEWD